MENELEGLAEPVRRAFLEIAGEAVCVCHEAYTSRDMKDPACNHDLAESVGIIRAELIRLARENAELRDTLAAQTMHVTVPTTAMEAECVNYARPFKLRAERAESELAALRERHVADTDAARNFPANTCAASRHVQLIGESLIRGEPYPMLQDESEHCGESMLATVKALWTTRDDLAALRKLLQECAPVVLAHNSTEHMLDGFGPRSMQPTDGLAERIRSLVEERV